MDGVIGDWFLFWLMRKLWRRRYFCESSACDLEDCWLLIFSVTLHRHPMSLRAIVHNVGTQFKKTYYKNIMLFLLLFLFPPFFSWIFKLKFEKYVFLIFINPRLSSIILQTTWYLSLDHLLLPTPTRQFIIKNNEQPYACPTYEGSSGERDRAMAMIGVKR